MGRTAYADHVKDMLLASRSSDVAEALADDLMPIELGTSHDEVKTWFDVAVHACQILNVSKKVVFVAAEQRTLASDAINHAMSGGYKVVTVPENIKERLHGIKDIHGMSARDLDVYIREFVESFEFKFVERNQLSAAERKI